MPAGGHAWKITNRVYRETEVMFSPAVQVTTSGLLVHFQEQQP